MPEASLQLRTLRLYGELLARSSTWAGKLVLTAGPCSSTTGLAAAASIAGGTSLSVDPDPASARVALREGNVDFVVNTLDEAIRVLKNEIRQGRPLGVVLTADPSSVRQEAIDRGLLPDLTVNAPDFPGREHVDFAAPPTPALQSWLIEQGWSEIAADPTQLSGFTGPRQAWLRGITAYQRSATREPRAIWLTEAEHGHIKKKYPPSS
jgi:hypothetical protein